jgi:hypothetical protein
MPTSISTRSARFGEPLKMKSSTLVATLATLSPTAARMSAFGVSVPGHCGNDIPNALATACTHSAWAEQSRSLVVPTNALIVYLAPPVSIKLSSSPNTTIRAGT